MSCSMGVGEGEGDGGGEGSNWGSTIAAFEDILAVVSSSDGQGRIGTKRTENAGESKVVKSQVFVTRGWIRVTRMP